MINLRNLPTDKKEKFKELEKDPATKQNQLKQEADAKQAAKKVEKPE